MSRSALLLVSSVSLVAALDNGLALTPVLAWSSWYSLNDTKLNEDAVKDTLEVMLNQGFVKAGFQIMILDDGWEAPQRDQMGYLHGNSELFPGGMKALVDHLGQHGVGLGLYTTPGNHTCLNNPASFGHIEQDVGLWVSDWGISYMKDCMCNTTKKLRSHTYRDMERAINATNKKVIFECDPPPSDAIWEMLSETCNLWGAHDDIYDTFAGWTDAVDDMETWKLSHYAQPSAWNLPDILRLGEGGQTFIEYQAQMGMYAILAAPLIIGSDLRTTSQEYLDLYLAPEVLQMDQDPLGKQGTRVQYKDNVDVFRRDLIGNDVGVHILNRGDAALNFSLPLSVVVTEEPVRQAHIRNVWTRKDVGVVATSETIVLQLQKHQGMLLRVSF